ncbi:MAG: hypothetical protein AAF198_06305 [Pseudomonadota bacterium]
MIDTIEFIGLTEDPLVLEIIALAQSAIKDDGAMLVLTKVEAALEVLHNQFVMGNLDS